MLNDVNRARISAYALMASCMLALSGMQIPTASAQDASPQVTAAAPATNHVDAPAATPRPVSRYAIEFRARSAQSYGHAYVVYGPLNANGRFSKPIVAGLHPATDSLVPFLVGHLVPVPSETGASDGDTEDKYVTARYRVTMNEGEYRKLLAFIKTHQATSPRWHAVLYNCVHFIRDIATYMKLKTPVAVYPEVWVNNLRELNSGREGVALTSIPYGQWGLEVPAEALGTTAPRRKTTATGSSRQVTPPASPSQAAATGSPRPTTATASPRPTTTASRQASPRQATATASRPQPASTIGEIQ